MPYLGRWLNDDNFWQNITHFNYRLLRNSFCTALSNKLRSRIDPSFKFQNISAAIWNVLPLTPPGSISMIMKM